MQGLAEMVKVTMQMLMTIMMDGLTSKSQDDENDAVMLGLDLS